MLMPSIFGENLFDDFFTFERPQKQYEKEVSCDLMKTDIREYEGGFELDINLPGCRKEDIQAELKDGTLTITAVSNKNTEEAAGRYPQGAVFRLLQQKVLCGRGDHKGGYPGQIRGRRLKAPGSQKGSKEAGGRRAEIHQHRGLMRKGAASQRPCLRGI